MNLRFTFLLLSCMWLFAASSVQGKSRFIRSVEPVSVSSPVGTAPELPWQVWVTYSDGYAEWRSVRWDNAMRQTEEAQADSALYPVGRRYEVRGFIIGDNTTAEGFPVTAEVCVVARPHSVPSSQPVVRPLPLADVRLTGSNRLTENRDLAIRTILSWDVAQQLYNYRDTYGLPTEGYPRSDGWDSPTTKLKGHGTGHYLSALAFAFASAGDETTKAELRRRIRRMVDEMRQCQERTFLWSDSLGRYWEARDLAPGDSLLNLKGTWADFDRYKRDYRHYGYGYLNAIPPQHALLVEAYRPYNNEAWVWAPYYTIHKQLAGLIDIARNIDEPDVAAKAILIARDMGLWVWNRLHYRTFVQTEGTQAERRERPGNRYEMWNMYIAGEVGGMAESLSRLSEMMTDTVHKTRLLEAAAYFDAPAFFTPLSWNIDDIRTRHANQHIPMITGALRSYRSNGNPYYYHLSRNFWNLVQGRYLYATGGVGNGEMFRQPYSQMLSMNTNTQADYHNDIYPNPNINETCCAYNLAKLTKELNGYTPDDATLMDYYERVLYNQIVGSLHPTHYGVTYQYAVGMNATKPFGNETPQSSCCGGTGAENHVKYQEAAYFVSDDDSLLYVALYLPTEARWRGQGVTVSQDCAWPAEKSTIRVRGGGEFAMRLRVPYWATQGFEVRLNGTPLSAPSDSRTSRYVEIPRRCWSADDVVEVTMPFTPHISFGPDKMELAATGRNALHTPFAPCWAGALMLGPLVMATPDVRTWDEADFRLSADLRELKVRRSPVYTCRLGNISFQPDYWHTDSCTHYLRLDVKARRKSARQSASASRLARLMQVARERQSAQEAWQAMATKVPDYAPWAPYGYARMLQAMQAADAAALDLAINTMRPGNLAEPEDLAELLTLAADLRENRPDKDEALREALRYADMVVAYVNDGSGTHDLIAKALSRLREFSAGSSARP
ncbi:MAG: glycoside hydrolase family 127 protein [Bacteroidaceae bacterium]|nr:glycoside hydrolase family 127 protein [Bacteroidaceae bacterium]